MPDTTPTTVPARPKVSAPAIAPITERRNGENFVCATRADFRYGALRPASAEDIQAALPYCVDMAGRKTLYVVGLQPEAVRAAPFYYLHARRHASAVLVRDWWLDSDALAHPTPPVFLFSTGRCGSTLVTRMLNAAGTPAVSEPDFYTQFTAGLLFAEDRSRFMNDIAATLRRMTADLCRSLGGDAPLIIKLRSDVSAAAHPMMTLHGMTRSLFICRDFDRWAHSTLRHFPCRPEQLVGQYVQSLHALSVLRQTGDCHLIRYEALLTAPTAEMQKIQDFLGRPLDIARGLLAMNGDAQAGTPLAQDHRPPHPDLAALYTGACALWQDVRREPKIAALLP